MTLAEGRLSYFSVLCTLVFSYSKNVLSYSYACRGLISLGVVRSLGLDNRSSQTLIIPVLPVVNPFVQLKNFPHRQPK